MILRIDPPRCYPSPHSDFHVDHGFRPFDVTAKAIFAHAKADGKILNRRGEEHVRISAAERDCLLTCYTLQTGAPREYPSVSFVFGPWWVSPACIKGKGIWLSRMPQRKAVAQ